MKAIRIIAFLLTLSMLFSLLIACDNQEEAPENTEPSVDDSPTDTPTDVPSDPSVESDLKYFIDIVDAVRYNGRDFDEFNIDIGQDSYMHVVKNTTPEEYDNFKTDLEKEGFVLYTTNTIGKNKFATYITETQIVSVMLLYYDYDETNKTDFGGKAAVDHYEVRIMEDNRYMFDLPGLEEDNVYTEGGYASFSMISNEKMTYAGRMGYVFQLTDGSFFIIDGGVIRDDPNLSATHAFMALLEEFAPDPNNIVIAGWLITHMHDDHVGVYCEISQNEEYLSKITVEKVIHNMPSESEMEAQKISAWQDSFNEATAIIRPQQKIKAHAGQNLYIRDLSLTIYFTQDILLYSTEPTSSVPKNFESNSEPNSASVVCMVNYQGKDMLFLADAHVNSFKYAINPIFRNDLKADMLQVAHHGYADTRADLINKYIQPEYVLWPLKKAHYDGKNPDGSIYYENNKAYQGVKDVAFNAVFFEDPNIKHIYHEKDFCITVDDFSVAEWQFYEWDVID